MKRGEVSDPAIPVGFNTTVSERRCFGSTKKELDDAISKTVDIAMKSLHSKVLDGWGEQLIVQLGMHWGSILILSFISVLGCYLRRMAIVHQFVIFLVLKEYFRSTSILKKMTNWCSIAIRRR